MQWKSRTCTNAYISRRKGGKRWNLIRIGIYILRCGEEKLISLYTMGVKFKTELTKHFYFLVCNLSMSALTYFHVSVGLLSSHFCASNEGSACTCGLKMDTFFSQRP